MTDRRPYVLGPGEGYTGLPAQQPKPADERTRDAAVRLARRALARRGPACHCGCGPHPHRHRDPAANHCALCGVDTCPSYRKAST